MRKIKYILTLWLIVVFCNSSAQNIRFITSGKIEYEKTINMFAVIKKAIVDNKDPKIQQEYEQYKNTQPQFKTQKAILTFQRENSLYVPSSGSEPTVMNDLYTPISEPGNLTYIDLLKKTYDSQKKVFDITLFVKDSVPHVKWKITDETREISGYLCRRANGIIFDSIYVVAFFCNRIPIASGPETFTGLPGMILGVVLPHENVTWFATKVTDMPVRPNEIALIKHNNTISVNQLYDQLNALIKNSTILRNIFYKALLL